MSFGLFGVQPGPCPSENPGGHDRTGRKSHPDFARFPQRPIALLYKELSELTGYEMSLPMNSGAEAVETALKLARKWAYAVKGIPRHQAEIITCAGNFHGRTITEISFSSEPLYRDDFGPFTPGFVTVPYGDCGRD